MADDKFENAVQQFLEQLKPENSPEVKQLDSSLQTSENEHRRRLDELDLMRKEKENLSKKYKESLVKKTKQEKLRGEHQEGLNEKTAELETLQKRIAEVKDENNMLTDKLKKCEEMVDKTKLSLAGLDVQSVNNVNRELALYKKLTHVRWHEDPDPGKVKGVVSEKTDARVFDLDKDKYSQFFVTNYIWNLMTAADEDETDDCNNPSQGIGNLNLDMN